MQRQMLSSAGPGRPSTISIPNFTVASTATFIRSPEKWTTLITQSHQTKQTEIPWTCLRQPHEAGPRTVNPAGWQKPTPPSNFERSTNWKMMCNAKTTIHPTARQGRSRRRATNIDVFSSASTPAAEAQEVATSIESPTEILFNMRGIEVASTWNRSQKAASGSRSVRLNFSELELEP